MQELITRLTEKAGISADQATEAVDIVKDFVKEKFPMMAGAVDNLLGGADATSNLAAAAAPVAETSIMDKISDVIPGEAGQKVEDFAKNAAHKAEEVFDDVKEKLSSMFGGDKK
jgi:hypothetical protein